MAVYLELFHGRMTPEEELDGWGFEGPVLGPLPFVHITYGFHIKFEEDFDLYVHKSGLVFFEGCYYGDFSIFDGRNFRKNPTGFLRNMLTKLTLKSTKNEWCKMITSDDPWIKTFAERRLMNLKIGASE